MFKEKYYLAIKKNKNNVMPLYVNSLNNGIIPDNIKAIDKFTSKFEDSNDLKDSLIATNAYNDFDLDGILVIAKYELVDGKLIYTKNFINNIVYKYNKDLLKNNSLFQNIEDNIENKELCNHIYNKFNNTDNEFFNNFINLFNNKSFLNNFEFCKDNIKKLILDIDYLNKRELSLYIDSEIIKNKKYIKERQLELIEKGV